MMAKFLCLVQLIRGKVSQNGVLDDYLFLSGS